MEIIKSSINGTIKCDCGCKFKYSKSDIDNSGNVKCPECSKLHKVIDSKSYSKTKVL